MIQNLIDMVLRGEGDSDVHALTIFSLILQNKCNNVLELGVRSGRTTIPMFNAVKILNGNLTSVDLDMPLFDYEILEHSYDKFKFIQSDSIEFLKTQVSKSIKYDFVHIDDWHDGLHVIKELNLISQMVDNKSIITLHDAMANTFPEYNKNEGHGEFGNGGVYRALSSLDSNEWEWCTIPVGHGLTILRKI
jgi:predicted O-methyltransferase YrrM